MYSSISELERKEANKKTGAKALFFSPTTGQTYSSRRTPDSIYFASTYEYLIYCELVKMAGRDDVKTQVPLLIKPATKKYDRKTWRCDLRIYAPDGHYINVECKGELTPEFKLMLPFLELQSPYDFERLVVVANHKPERIDKVMQTVTWSVLENWLQSHGYDRRMQFS